MIRFPGSSPPGSASTPGLNTIPWQPAQSPDPPRISAATDRATPARSGAAAPILASGWMTNGPEVAAFEREFADHVGARCAVAVSSGSAAIELCLRALRLPHGSRVLVSTLAPTGVVHAIVRANLRPVLLDVSVHTGMPTSRDLIAAVRAQDKRPRAMVVVHWDGDPADVAELSEAAGLPSSAMIEDAGQALGASHVAGAVGRSGSACFSFYSTAHLPIGEGGMVTTEDPDRAAVLTQSRERGISPAARRHVRQGHVGPHVLRDGGLQSTLTEQSASSGRLQLERLPAWQRRRRELAARYDACLAGIPGVALPHRPPSGGGEHAWQSYPVRIERPAYERDRVVRALAAAGIGSTFVPPPLHQLAYCRSVSELPSTGLPGADRFADQLVSLPIYPRLTNAAVDRVGEVLQEALCHRAPRSNDARSDAVGGP